MEYEYTYILTALITSLIGSIVRIFHDSEKVRIKGSRILMILTCSLVTAYICYELALHYQEPRLAGIPSIILALASVEITKFFRSIIDTVFEGFIKRIPKILDSIIKSIISNYKDDPPLK